MQRGNATSNRKGRSEPRTPVRPFQDDPATTWDDAPFLQRIRWLTRLLLATVHEEKAKDEARIKFLTGAHNRACRAYGEAEERLLKYERRRNRLRPRLDALRAEAEQALVRRVTAESEEENATAEFKHKMTLAAINVAKVMKLISPDGEVLGAVRTLDISSAVAQETREALKPVARLTEIEGKLDALSRASPPPSGTDTAAQFRAAVGNRETVPIKSLLKQVNDAFGKADQACSRTKVYAALRAEGVKPIRRGIYPTRSSVAAVTKHLLNSAGRVTPGE